MREPFSPAVPEPHLWSCRDPDSTEDEVLELLYGLVRAEKPKVAVEVGSHVGMGSEAVGMALSRNGRGFLHTFEVDPVRARLARRATAGLPVKVYELPDFEYDPVDLEAPVDFLFVDGDDRGRSLDHWGPQLSEGALVAVHDTLKYPEYAQGVPDDAFVVVTPRGLSVWRHG